MSSAGDTENARLRLEPITRVVTGHDATGKAIVLQHGALPNVHELKSVPGVLFHEVWCTAPTPVQIQTKQDDPTDGPLTLPPPKAGTRIRFVDIPPDNAELLAKGEQAMREAFAEIGHASASTVRADSPHPVMHRTETVDYGIVIEGQVTLILDDSEVLLEPGTVVIQRGTNHAWANRTDRMARMAFILIDGQFDSALAGALEQR